MSFIQHDERLLSNHSFNFTITISSSPAEPSAVSHPMMLRTFNGCVIGPHAACNQGRKSLNGVIIIFKVPDRRFESLIRCAIISKVNFRLDLKRPFVEFYSFGSQATAAELIYSVLAM